MSARNQNLYDLLTAYARVIARRVVPPAIAPYPFKLKPSDKLARRALVCRP